MVQLLDSRAFIAVPLFNGLDSAQVHLERLIHVLGSYVSAVLQGHLFSLLTLLL
jgi:hypothetical protein